MTPPTRARNDAAKLAAEAERYLSARDEAEDAAARRALLDRHGVLFEPESIASLRAALEGAEGDESTSRRRLLRLSVEGYLARATAELDERIEEAEAAAIVVWRGTRLPYRSVPERAAAMSDRVERNALERSYGEAVEATNLLRAERLERLREAYRSLGWRDLLDAATEVRGFNPVTLALEVQRFMSASETVYYAAQRRYLALIDIEQGDASDVDLRHVMRGAAWDHWFDARRASGAAASTLDGLGLQGAPALTAAPGWQGWSAALDSAGRSAAGAAGAAVDTSAPASDRLLGDRSVLAADGILLGELIGEPGWVAEHARMPQEELPGWLDFAAFRRLHRLRHETAMLLYELRLYREDDRGVARAYFAGVVGLLTGVIMPESGYLMPAADPLGSATRMRAEILASCLADLLRQRHGTDWWRVPEAGETLRQGWGRGAVWDAEAVVAHLGYDRYDWRPVLRQIRTRLIGEMSGYGGPNITTRAGTRKI
jgi:hypothetical protein